LKLLLNDSSKNKITSDLGSHQTTPSDPIPTMCRDREKMAHQKTVKVKKHDVNAKKENPSLT